VDKPSFEFFNFPFPTTFNIFSACPRPLNFSFDPYQDQLFFRVPEVPSMVVAPRKQPGKDDCVVFQQDLLSEQLQKQQQTCEVVDSNELSYACKWGSCYSSFSTRTGLATHIAAHLEHFFQNPASPKKQKLDICCHWRECAESASNFGDVKQLARHLASESHVGQMPFVPKINGVTINKDYKDDLSHTQKRKK